MMLMSKEECSQESRWCDVGSNNKTIGKKRNRHDNLNQEISSNKEDEKDIRSKSTSTTKISTTTSKIINNSKCIYIGFVSLSYYRW